MMKKNARSMVNPKARYLNAKLRPVQPNGVFIGYSRDDIRAMQDALIDELENVLKGKGSLDPEMVLDLLISFKELRSGHTPDLMKSDPVTLDRPIFGVLKQDAVNYIAAVKRNILRDASFKKTVAEAYGVDRRTVTNWCNEFSPSLGRIRSAEKIEKRMRISGMQFKRFRIELQSSLDENQ